MPPRRGSFGFAFSALTATLLVCGQGHANDNEVCMTDTIVSQTANYITDAESALVRGDNVRASELFDLTISTLGDRYSTPDVVDDTSMKLALAKSQQKTGHTDISIQLKKSVAQARLGMYKAKIGC